MDIKEKKAIYNPEADKKWKDANRERRNYLSGRGAARSFIRNKATLENLDELIRLIEERKESIADNNLTKEF